MARLVLKIRRGNQVIGSWSLGDQPLEMVIEDAQTGQVLGRFTAEGSDETTLHPISATRSDGDDLTMPLPESAPQKPPSPDDPTSLSVSLPLPEDIRTGDTQARIERAYQYGSGDGLNVLMQSDDLSLSVDELEPGEQLQEVDTGSWIDTMSVSIDPDLSGVFKAVVLPAEVWLRRDREWHRSDDLEVGSRIDAGGGYVGLDTEGRLLVCTGPQLTGTVTQLDGSSYELRSSARQQLLALGAAVMLRDGAYGIYVRSCLPEGGRLDQPTEESPS